MIFPVVRARACIGRWSILVQCKMIVLCFVAACTCTRTCTSQVAAFTIANVRARSSILPAQRRCGVSPGIPPSGSNYCNSYSSCYNLSHPVTIRQGSVSNDNEHSSSTNTGTSWLYGSLWATFLVYAFFGSPGQVGDPVDLQMLQSYIDNPGAPEGFNALFLLIFNGVGIMPLFIAQLACPQGNKSGGVPAAPFLAASMATGFIAAGIYLTFRSPPVSQKPQEEASWFTRTILESKITSIVSLLLLGLSVTSALGTLPVPQDTSITTTLSSVFSDFLVLASQSKFVSVNSLDLLMFTIAAATLIPRDLQLRMRDEDDDDHGTRTLALGRSIAAGTLLFPIFGAALYCLWRPPLPTE